MKGLAKLSTVGQHISTFLSISAISTVAATRLSSPSLMVGSHSYFPGATYENQGKQKDPVSRYQGSVFWLLINDFDSRGSHRMQIAIVITLPAIVASPSLD